MGLKVGELFAVLGVEDGPFDRKMASVMATAQSMPDADVQVDADSAVAQAQLGKVAAVAQSMPDADVQVDVDTGAAMAKLAAMRASFGGLSTRVNAGVTSMGRGFIRLGTSIKGAGIAAAGFAAGFAGVAFLGVRTNAQLETATLQFETLMGSAEQATEHVKGLFEFAGSTPFETAPIIEASRIMETFGGAALNSEDNLRRFGDAAAATTQPIEDVAFWMSRAYADIQAGRPFGEAAARLSEMGVITPQVRAKLEDLQETGADGKVVWDELQGSLGRFDGAMVNMSKTWAGITSTLSDTAQIAAGEMTEPFFGALSRLGLAMIDFSETPAWDSIIASGRRVFEGLAGYIDQVTAGLEEGGLQGAMDALAAMWNEAIGKINWGAIGTGLLTAVETALQGVGALVPQLIQVISTALSTMDWGPISEQMTTALINMLTAIDWGKLAETAVDLLVTIVPAIIDGFVRGLINVATQRPLDFGMFFVALGFLPGKVLGALAGVLSRIPILGTIFGWILRALGGVARQVLAPIRSLFSTLGNKIMGGLAEGVGFGFGYVAGMVGRIPGFIGRFFAGAGRWLWNAGAQIMQGLANGIGAGTGGLWGLLSRIPSMIFRFFAGAGNWLVGAGQSIMGGLVRGISSAIGAVRNTLARVTSWLPDWKGPPAKDAKLLYGSGQLVMKGFSAGIRSQFGEVRSVLGDVTDIAGTLPATGALTLAGAAGGSSRQSSGGWHGNVIVQGSVVTERDLARTIDRVLTERGYSSGRRR